MLTLVYPVDLDVPMMVSFLAALQGGVSFQDESVRRSLAGTEREREGRGSIRSGIPGLSQLLGFDMSGRIASRGRDEESEEVRAVRQHTSSSLFNTLHDFLLSENYVEMIEEDTNVESFRVGQMVQITGAFVGNHLQYLLAFFDQASPYLDMEQRVQEKVQSQYKLPTNRSGGSQKGGRSAPQPTVEEQQAAIAEAAAEVEREFGLAMLKQMNADLADAPVHDTVIEAAHGVRVALTMASEFYTRDASERLRAGNFTALGKVTRVLKRDEEINLTRRTVLGAAGSSLAQEMLSNFERMPGLALEAGTGPVITEPAIQVLPLAVFV
jgi:hypothetical protein